MKYNQTMPKNGIWIILSAKDEAEPALTPKYTAIDPSPH